MPPRKRKQGNSTAAAESLARARRALLAPHHGREDRGFEKAFEECENGLGLLKNHKFDPGSSQMIETIRKSLDVTGFSNGPWTENLWIAKIRRMSIQDKEDFAQAVDSLATHLILKSYGVG